MYYWRAKYDATKGAQVKYNFGDELSPVLVHRILDMSCDCEVNIEWESLGSKSSKLLAVGSIFSAESGYHRGDAVWGSGMRSSKAKDEFQGLKCDDISNIFTVRGPFSRSTLKSWCPSSPGIAKIPEVYGDPGLLLPYLFPADFPRKSEANNRTTVTATMAAPNRQLASQPSGLYDNVIFIPHMNSVSVVADNQALLERLKISVVQPYWSYKVPDNEATVGAMKHTLRDILNKIRAASFVLSSSLHGIIMADAFGVPARLVVAELHENLFKYEDYYASTGRSDIARLVARNISHGYALGGCEPPRNGLDDLSSIRLVEALVDNIPVLVQKGIMSLPTGCSCSSCNFRDNHAVLMAKDERLE